MHQELNMVVMPDGTLQPEWTDSQEVLDQRTQSLQREIADGCRDHSWLLTAGLCDRRIPLSPSLDFWRTVTSAFVRKLTQIPNLEDLRHKVVVSLEPELSLDLLQNAPLVTGCQYLTRDVLESVWKKTNEAFAAAIAAHDGTVQSFFQARQAEVHLAGRVYFHLVENKDGELPFAFLATYSTRLSQDGKSRHMPLRHALQEYGKDSQKLLELLATVYRAAKDSALITKMIDSGELFHPLAWTAREAFVFFKEISLYEAAGILCRIPNWWRGKALGASLNVSLGDRQPSFVGMNAILSMDTHLFLGDVEITEAQARQLLENAEGLAFIKNRWVVADPEKVKQTLEAYQNAKKLMKQGVTLQEALRLQLSPERFLGAGAKSVDVGVSNGLWLESVMEKLKHPERISSLSPGNGFSARLRPYQQKGVNWLGLLHSLRFGACLADDMGLGKTVQVLGFLSALKAMSKDSRQPASLLVIPASLIANWMGEIQTFSPTLNVFVAHPDMHRPKAVEPLGAARLDGLDLVITTYALVQKYDWLQSYNWAYVILDEAQAIKNPGTKQTRAVKKLTAGNRIVMTGTPIENRLSDLWSLFDFLNPGLLGTAKEFSAFAKRVKEDPTGFSRLRKVIAPYLLRRLKTDKTVITDLPDKVELKSYASLSPQQVVFYRKLVTDLRQIIQDTEGIQRKGLILASLMKFKQICNHPDQYLGTGDFEESSSGKFSRLREICETIYEKRERVLVFTQFKEMTEPLAAFLATLFHRQGLVLHGSVAVGKRKAIIEKFQGSEYIPFMVLSLKAGGVGLNLTAANHVIHFDRWWNPAVENQATDRVFRIGQKKKVMVHKFITRGTVEEKIDAMLEAKAKLSKAVVAAAGENWITEMSTEELMELFQLRL
jgi:hypothetical protein